MVDKEGTKETSVWKIKSNPEHQRMRIFDKHVDWTSLVRKTYTYESNFKLVCKLQFENQPDVMFIDMLNPLLCSAELNRSWIRTDVVRCLGLFGGRK